MTVVTVEATWRMNRVEFVAPHSESGTVIGYGEILLEEPDAPGGIYGVLPAEAISRQMADVMQETVDVQGMTVTFDFAVAALEAFFERWRSEDEEELPPPEMPLPRAAPLTEMPERLPPPAYTDTVPPPTPGDWPAPPPSEE